jgi:phenylpropionate dioxygenase-like ring-hydroxylating dioxygenase large terminal subunit
MMAEDLDSRRGEVPYLITDPERIPVQRYYDEAFYKLECARLWPHVWQMACRIEQIPNVGDWVEYSNVGKSVIVVRTAEGIKAFHNVCRHRGVQLVAGQDHGNCRSQGFVCPFHGWRWNMDGRNTFVYAPHLFSERQLNEGDIALKPVRCEEWIGCVFINFDNDAMPIRESAGPAGVGLEAYNSDRLRSEWWLATVLPANWKIAMEAFMEGYHTMKTHPQLHAARPAQFNAIYSDDTDGIARANAPRISVRDSIAAQVKQMELLTVGMAGMCHPKDIAVAKTLLDAELPEDPDQAVAAWYGMVNQRVTEEGRARGEPTPDLNHIARNSPVKPVEFLFPHYFVLPFLSSFASYRIRPLSPETCLFELWALTHFPEGQEPEVPMKPRFLPHDSKEYPPIPQQDYANIPRQQLGLHCGEFEYMRLAKSIEGLISNYQRLIDGYLQGKPLDVLGQAMRKLSGNFNGELKDMEI